MSDGLAFARCGCPIGLPNLWEAGSAECKHGNYIVIDGKGNQFCGNYADPPCELVI